MSGVLRILLLPQLALVVRPDKEADCTAQGHDTAGETARFPSKPGQIMSQIGVAAFNRVGLAFIQDGTIARITIHQGGIRGKAITVIVGGLGCRIHQGLQPVFRAVLHHSPSDIAVRRTVHQGYNVDFVFFVVTKVYNSSISTVSTWDGTGGAAGTRSAAAVTQLITV